MEALERMKKLSQKIHKGQKRKGGEDYFNHVNRVSKLAMGRAKEVDDNDLFVEMVGVVGLAHDLVEDHPDKISFTDIENDFGTIIADAVELLTKYDGDDYADYIVNLKYASGSAGEIARIVKLADLTDNMKDLKKTKSQYAKYRLSFFILTGVV